MLNKLEQTIYGYNTTEFLPIFEGENWVNKDEFARYKAGKLLTRLHIDRQSLISGLTYLNDAIAQNTLKPTA